MERVFSVADNPLEEIDRVAIGVYSDGAHIGLLHRASGKEQPQLLHLLTHRVCRSGAVNKSCVLWVKPLLAIEKANQVVALARLVYRSNSGFESIPYGFSPYTGYFSSKGSIRSKVAGWGLTCSTFILALFDLASIRLVLGETWPEREEDREWQRGMIEEIASAKPPRPEASPAHVKGMKEDVGEKRFKPLEVAGAAAANTYPVDFTTSYGLATQVKVILDGMSKPSSSAPISAEGSLTGKHEGKNRRHPEGENNIADTV